MVTTNATSALSTAIEGLNVASQQLQVISANVANASTAGYTTKTLNTSSVIIGDEPAGVAVGNITRATDPSLQYDLWQQNSIASASTTTQSYLNQVQQLFGTPSSNSSIAATLNQLQSSYVSLSADPGNSVYQTQVVDDAQQVAQQYNSMSSSIQNLRNSTQSDMTNDVSQVNSLLKQIAESNTQIVAINNTGGDSTDVQDQRDEAISQLSQYMNVSTYSNGDGSVTVQTPSGTLLADTSYTPLTFTAIPQTATSYYPQSANGIMLNGTDISSQITSGDIGSLLSLRDTVLPQAQAMLDESAEQLASRFSAQGTTLFTNSLGAVPNDNDPTAYAGFSADIQVNTAVVNNASLVQQGTAGGATLDPGDNTNVMKVLDYAFGTTSDSSGAAQSSFNTTGLGPGGNLTISLPSSASIIDYTQTMISALAQQYSQATSDQTYQQNYNQTLQTHFDNETSVSIDQQMTTMISVQQAYSASARMITAVSSMFTQLLDSVQV